jgi:4-amino-4-deoxy-L-arabinose transferase-like glycosyltransferase
MIADLLRLALAHLGAAALFAWLVAAVGRRALRRLEREGPAERLVLDFAAGYALLGQVLFVFGLVGWIARGPILALLAVLVVALARDAVAVAKDARAVLRPPCSPRARAVWRGWVLVFVVVAPPMLVLALYPPTGFDALNYHLPFVESFARSGHLVFNDTLRFPVFPQLVEVVLTIPYLLVGDLAAEAFLIAPALAVAVVVGLWAGRAGGRSSGPWAAAIWLGSPLVVWMAAQAYVDLSLSLFVVAGLYCLDRWRIGSGRGWLVLGGALLGAACSTKYLGLPWLAFGVLLVWTVAPAGRRARSALLATAAALVLAVPWYARIAWETGNPVFPYLRAVFGGDDWLTPDARADPIQQVVAPDVGVERGRRSPFRGGIVGVLALPVSVTWARDAFDHQAPITPWALPVVLAVAWGARRDRRLRWLLLASTAYCCTLLLQQRIALRFVLPPAAVLSAAGAVAFRPVAARLLVAVRRRGGARVLRGGALGVLGVLGLAGLGGAYGCYKLAERGVPPIDAEGRSAYLGRWIPGFEAVDHLDRESGSGYALYGLYRERVRYYARGRYVGDWYGPFRFALVESHLGRPEELHALLRSWGIDHLMVPRALDESWGETAGPCFVPVWKDRESTVFRLAITDGAESGCRPGRGEPGDE